MNEQRELMAQLKTLADEFRVKAHLASMDARKLWEEEIEPALDNLDRRFDNATRDLEISDDLKELDRKLRKLIDDVIEPKSRRES